MQIAYLVNQYPGISHTFVRREIQAMERQGVRIARFAMRRAKTGIISAEDGAEAVRTRAIVGAPIVAIAAAAAATLARAPLRSLRALTQALRLGWKSEAGLVRHFIYYAEALVLAAWMRAEKTAHVHAHFGTNSATVAMLAAEMNAVGFSMTVHGPEEFDKPALIGLAAKIRASRFTAAVSSYGASQLRRLVEPAAWDRIRIVRCGIEPEFYAGALAPPPAEPRLVSIGRLAPQKGQPTLIEAAALLKQEGLAFSVTLVGDGEMRADLEDAARRLNVRDRIIFAGWKTPADVRAEIEGARALVLPSYAEGLPVTIMEAFALERPAIATYVAGIPELVAPGENGWLAPAGDADALAAAMREALCADPSRLLEMGRAGRRRIEALHDIDKIAAALKEEFAKALRRKAAS